MGQTNNARILIAGDYSPRERVQNVINKGNGEQLFLSIRPIVDKSDCFIVNYETVVASSADSPIKKLGASLRTSSNSIEVLKLLGVDVVTLANNHFLDFGGEAAKKTVSLFNKEGIDTVGAGNNLDMASAIYYRSINGIRFAIINACEHEFSIAGKDSYGCNPIDPINLSYRIREAGQNSDRVVCIFHGGNEHYQLPSPRMKKWYRFFVDCGADVVINHHQHCFSGFEVYRGKPIFYGLGNFCFDSASDNLLRHKTWNYGYMVSLVFQENSVEFELVPYEQCWDRPGVFVLQNLENIDSFYSKLQDLNEIISDDNLLAQHYRQMSYGRRSMIYSGFRPYSSRLLRWLNAHNLFPSFIKPSQLTIIKAFLDCESHHDVLIYNLSADDISSKPKL